MARSPPNVMAEAQEAAVAAPEQAEEVEEEEDERNMVFELSYRLIFINIVW